MHQQPMASRHRPGSTGLTPTLGARALARLVLLLLFTQGCAGPRPPIVKDPRAAARREGCAIIVTDDDIPSGSATAGALYLRDAALGKKLLTADVLAVAKGFREAGFACVQAIDSHDGAIDPLPLAKIGVPLLTPSSVKNWRWPFIGPMQEKVTVAALVGFHSAAGQDGFRPHTINDSIRVLRINGQTVGEVTHLIMALGAFDVPVVLVSGDMNAAAEARRALPQVSTVTVRWHARDGRPRFLSSAAAAAKLGAAARQAATSEVEPFRPTLPIAIELETYSAGLMADRSRSIPATYRALLEKAPAIKRRLGSFDFGSSLSVAGSRLSWRAPSALAAYLSIVFAASHLRSARNWKKVARGYSAFQAGDYPEAVKAYRQALKASPHDLATKCRLAAVHQALWKLRDAHALFSEGVARLDEIAGTAMKSWCLLGLAQTNLALGNTLAAEKQARRVLRWKNAHKRHDEARALLELIGTFKAAARQVFLRLEEFRFITRKLETVYSYLEIKQQRHRFSYADLKARIKQRIRAAASEGEYLRALAHLLARFKDGHLRIKSAATRAPPSKRLPRAVRHRWLPGRVLVTRISRLWGGDAEIAKQLEEGLARLRRARALIVDLRGNGGGNDALAFAYLSRIIARAIPLGRFSLRMSPDVMRLHPHYTKLYQPDPQRPGFSKWVTFSVSPKTKAGFGGPIAILIDRACYSSCEGTALAFKQSGSARLFGQNTGGGSANPITLELPLTPGRLMVPTWIQIMPDGDLLEDNGVPPDVKLPVGRDAFPVALSYLRKQIR